MLSFDKIEEEFGKKEVSSISPNLSGHGVLTLDKRNTELKFSAKRDESINILGKDFFDLELDANLGSRIFLRNAFCTKQITSGNKLDRSSLSIFPNFVVIDSNNLNSKGKLTEIRFTFQNMYDFFYFKVADILDIKKISSDTLNIFAKEWSRNSNKTPFNPDNVIVTSQLPRILEFRIHDRRYEIKFTYTITHSFSNPSFKISPNASIIYDKPVQIEDAVNHIWEWRQFFHQISMEQLPFRGIGTRIHDESDGYASLYLPNLDESMPSNHRYDFYPGLAPLNDWNERNKYAEIMKNWLSKSEERAIFRKNLDQVIINMRKKSTPDHIMNLTSGLESLGEFNGHSTLSKGAISTLTRAVIDMATKECIDIDANRVHGILSMLRSQSLSQRLRDFGDTISVIASPKQQILHKEIKKIRNSSAHGNAKINQLLPIISPVTYAFASICALWDLESCGMPTSSLKGSSSAYIIATDAMNYLDNIE